MDNDIILPQISAIIPAYNAAHYVERAIESVLAQTYPVRELFVVDDGSTDNTADIVARYGKTVHLVRQTNGGPGAARNHGARLASGDWLALLDADDKWLPHKLERQVGFTQDATVGIVQSWDSAGDNQPPDDITFERLWQRNCVANSSVLIRRAAFEAVGGFDEDRALIAVEDYNLWLRVVAAGWEIATYRGSLVAYESAPGHLSSQLERATQAEFANIENIGRRLGMSEAAIQAKRVATSESHGRYLLYHREMRLARRLLGVSLRVHPTPARLARWLTTFAPPALLNRARDRKTSAPSAKRTGRAGMAA